MPGINGWQFPIGQATHNLRATSIPAFWAAHSNLCSSISSFCYSRYPCRALFKGVAAVFLMCLESRYFSHIVDIYLSSDKRNV